MCYMYMHTCTGHVCTLFEDLGTLIPYFFLYCSVAFLDCIVHVTPCSHCMNIFLFVTVSSQAVHNLLLPLGAGCWCHLLRVPSRSGSYSPSEVYQTRDCQVKGFS